MSLITITYEEWKRGTELGVLYKRSNEMEAIGKALKQYHLEGRTERAFLSLRTAFDNWMRAQQRAGKAWTESGRNKSDIVSRLHHQIVQIDAERTLKLMADPEEMQARVALVQAERDALKRLFEGRRLVYKYDGQKHDWKHRVDRAINTGVLPGAFVGGAVYGAGKQALGHARVAVTPYDVSTFVSNHIAGSTPQTLWVMLGTSAEQFFSAAATILSAAIAPAKLMIDIALAAKKGAERSGIDNCRGLLKSGQAEAALDAVIRMIDRELRLLAVDMGKQVASIVANSFAMGPVASAANAVVDILVNIRQYAKVAEEIEEANRLLSTGKFSLELFDASPVLGCYFLILADTNVWINFSAFDIGTPGWMDTVEKLRKKSQVVREKAREFIRASKLAVSGTEFMKGLEWESTWKNNKIDFLAQLTNVDYLGDKIHKKFSHAPSKFVKPQVDPTRIYAIGRR